MKMRATLFVWVSMASSSQNPNSVAYINDARKAPEQMNEDHIMRGYFRAQSVS